MPLQKNTMQVNTIRVISNQALASALGASPAAADADARVAAMAAEHPTFAETYPTLLRMCCEATTDERQQSVRHFLPMMLHQLQLVRRNPGDSSVMHNASVEVGKAVGAKYLPEPQDGTDVAPAKRKRC